MPVTTKTLYNMTILNRVFAASGILMAIVMVVAVLEDWSNEYRKHQVEARTWSGAYSEWDLMAVEQQAREGQLEDLKTKLSAEEQMLAVNPRLAEIDAELEELGISKAALFLRLSLETKGNIAPVAQREEEYRVLGQKQGVDPIDTAKYISILAEANELKARNTEGENQLKEWDDRKARLKAERGEITARLDRLQGEVDNLQIAVDKAREARDQLKPGPMATAGRFLRDQPLLDWLNPSIKVKQQRVEKVLTDVNLMTIATLDRCMSCHVNIDNDKFEQGAMWTFLERRIAAAQGETILEMGEIKPVVEIGFWENAIVLMDAGTTHHRPAARLAELRDKLSITYNRLIRRAPEKHPIRSEWVTLHPDRAAQARNNIPRVESAEDLHEIFGLLQGRHHEGWQDWYAPLTEYRETLVEIVEDELDKTSKRALFDAYRHRIVAVHNQLAAEHGWERLSSSRTMLAHPKLDLYAHPDSKHPIVSMGCTSCHAGSGEETQFVHTSHTPADIWVDQKSGMLVPDFAVRRIGAAGEIARYLQGKARGPVREIGGADATSSSSSSSPPPLSRGGMTTMGGGSDDSDIVIAASFTTFVSAVSDESTNRHGNDTESGHWAGDGRLTEIHADHWYADPALVDDPFSPRAADHGDTAVYLDIATGAPRRAIKQVRRWEDQYGYEEIKFHIWERPMHELRFVQSSCLRCHQQVLEIDKEAPVLARGRKLFAEIGCIDCHPTDQLGSPLRNEPGLPDVRQVGPNLVNIIYKLDRDMISSWVLAPKAFRPGTRMPHTWLTENGSSPLDIRRSRAEVGAIGHYLTQASQRIAASPRTLAQFGEDLARAARAVADASPDSAQSPEDAIATAVNLFDDTLGEISFISANLSDASGPFDEATSFLKDATKALIAAAQRVRENRLGDEVSEASADPLSIAAGIVADASTRIADLARIVADVSYSPEAMPEELAGSVRSGRELFQSVGCLACHANVHEHGLDMVTLNVMERFSRDKPAALEMIAADARWIQDHPQERVPDANLGFFELDADGVPLPTIMPAQFTRLSWYLMAFEPQRYSRFGPDLAGVGTKLLHNRTAQQATTWLYGWLRQPNHYSAYTVMPSFRLSEQEALDIAAYLLTQRHPTYQPQHFAADEQMVDALLINMQAAKISDRAARRMVTGMPIDDKLYDLGRRVIQHYGCFGCHQVPGFNSGSAVSAALTTWGTRDPHKLDFGYFDHVYEQTRTPTVEVWTTYKEGTFEGAVKLTERSIGTGISRITVPWEHVPVERRGYLEAKLHNARIFDRNRIGRDGAMTPDGRILFTSKSDDSLRLVETIDDGRYVDAETGEDSNLDAGQVRILDVGKPYDKLRMPRFFLTRSDAEALVTYVTGLAPPLVSRELQETTDDMGTMRAKGKLMVEAFNCMACHVIENNDPLIQQYYQVRREDGSIDYTETVDNIANAPPRLVGNGAKTQPDWFYKFLNDVTMLRPWLNIRMPSFNLTAQQTLWIVEYFAGQTAMESRTIARHLGAVSEDLRQIFNETYDAVHALAMADGQGQANADTIAKAEAALAVGAALTLESKREARASVSLLASDYKLKAPSQLPNRDMTPEILKSAYGQLFYDLDYLHDTYDEARFPFVEVLLPRMSELDMYRAEKLVRDDLKCFECHAFGEPDKLERIFRIKQAQLAAEAPAEGDENDQGLEEDEYGYEEEDAEAEYDFEEGDEQGYGYDDQGSMPDAQSAEEASYLDFISAPNLAEAHLRLQPNYIKRWLRKPQVIMPGTKMPDHFGPDGLISHFSKWGPLQQEKEALYGSTADEQIDLIVNWLWVAGQRNYTIDEHLLDAEAVASNPAILEAVRSLNSGQELTEAEVVDLARQMVLSEHAARIAQWEARLKAEADARISALRSQPVSEREPQSENEADQAAPKPSDESDDRPTAEAIEAPTSAGIVRSGVMSPEKAAADREQGMARRTASAPPDGTGRIVGFALYPRDFQPRRDRRVNNAQCREIQKRAGQKMPVRQEVIVNANRTLANVVVYLAEPPDIEAIEGSQQPDRTINQQGCTYIPHVVSLTTGQTLAIRNNDPQTAHNLNLRAEFNKGFNESQPVQGMVLEKRFTRPEMAMRLKCDVHTWMAARIFVFDHPFHSVTDDQGVYTIEGLPPGEYEIEVWHEEFPTQRFVATIVAGETLRHDLTYGGK